jgi:hypothetical protein
VQKKEALDNYHAIEKRRSRGQLLWCKLEKNKMNLNQYTDNIIKILKETPANNQHTIWKVFINDKEIRNRRNFSQINIDLLDRVFLTDLKKIKKEGVTDLWKHTENCYIHESSSPFMEETSRYEGDIILDIKNELMQLIVLDMQVLSEFSAYEKQG